MLSCQKFMPITRYIKFRCWDYYPLQAANEKNISIFKRT